MPGEFQNDMSIANINIFLCQTALKAILIGLLGPPAYGLASSRPTQFQTNNKNSFSKSILFYLNDSIAYEKIK